MAVVDRFEHIARDVAPVVARWAAAVDRDNRFPSESVQALRDAGLLAIVAPRSVGGHDASLETVWRVATVLGAACPSTALIWAMHCSQVAVLARHGADRFGDVLADVARTGALISSVTSEPGTPGDLMSARTPVERDERGVRVVRPAPFVSYGAEAAYYVIKMRASEAAPATHVVHVVATPGDGEIAVERSWSATGMRGTQTVAMRFDLTVPPERVIDAAPRLIALRTLLPVAHVGWAGAWYGSAERALAKVIQALRIGGSRGGRSLAAGELLRDLGRIRLRLDRVRALTERLAERVDAWGTEDGPASRYESATYRIELNNVKLLASEDCCAVADELITIAGLKKGYLQDDPDGLERTYRDLRSAPLMFANEHLYQSNGRLMLFERAALHELTGPADDSA